MATEQKSVGRQLDYSLGRDVLDRVKGAATQTANVELQKLKGKTDAINQVTRTAYQIGGALDRGREKTKELNQMWDDAISRDQFATPEAMNNFKELVNVDKEAYIEAVRTGNKEEQERLLGELGDNTKQLENTKGSIEGLTSDYNEIGFKTSTESFPTANQGAAATLAKNTNVTYVKENGAMLSVIDSTQDISDELGEMTRGANESEQDFLARRNEYLNGLVTGEHIGSYQFADADGNEISINPDSNIDEMLRTGEITVKRKFNSAQVDALAKQARKPVELTQDITNMLDQFQAGASDPNKPTYFDYGSTNNMIKNAITPEDVSSYIYEDVGAGVFADEFMHNPNLNMPIMVGFEDYDTDGDGMLSPKEQQTPIDHDGDPDTPKIPVTLDDDQKKLLVKEMAKPENVEIARELIGEWLTMKAYGNWKLGVDQRQVEEKTGTGKQGDPYVVRNVPANIQIKETGGGAYGGYYQEGGGVMGETMASGGVEEGVTFGAGSGSASSRN